MILNRPTAYSTLDLETSLKFDNFSHEGVDDWNVWCGGDCQGINSRGRIPPEPGAELGTGRIDDDIYIYIQYYMIYIYIYIILYVLYNLYILYKIYNNIYMYYIIYIFKHALNFGRNGW